MLITIVFLLLIILLGSFIVLRIRRQDGQATTSPTHREPALRRETIADLDSDDALGLKSSAIPEKKIDSPKKELSHSSASVKQEPPEYILLNIMAPQEYSYNGYELLQALLTNGLRYGDRNIFHRHETKTGRGCVLFSLASINKPGTFELPKMGNFSCPGLVLFMVLKDLPDAMQAFETMLETAKQLAEDLGGEVRDEKRQTLNMDKITQIRARIRKFEEKRRTPDFFEEETVTDLNG